MPQTSLADAVALVRPRDMITCPFAAGQPSGFLDALGGRTDLEDVTILSGILIRPFSFLSNPGVRLLSGFFGPIERMARKAGMRVEYLAGDFHGLERLAIRTKPRVVVMGTTLPDADGWLSFGLHAGAAAQTFLDAARDPDRVAIAEANPRMPRVFGHPEHGDHRIHVSAVDAWFPHDDELPTLPAATPTPEELRIADHILALIGDGATLQFGIGGVPNEVAKRLATGPLGDFGIHTEMIADGVMALHQAGKVTNRKGLYDGVTVGTFALGSDALYRWMDGNPAVQMLPVSATNEPFLLRKLRRFVSVNGALTIDVHGQIVADHIGGRQYSGVGGHESFVVGAAEAPGGTSIVCLRSTATVHGTTISTIVPQLPAGSVVTTPRHHPQWIVTEHGAVDVSLLGDRERARALIGVAHPDFRAELTAALG